jgi:hypothetical protein
MEKRKLIMTNYTLAFTCIHPKKKKEDLEKYIEKFNEDVKTSELFLSGDGNEIKFISELNKTIKTPLTKLKNDGFIFNTKSNIELHRVVNFKGLGDIKGFFTGVLRSQTQNHLINKNYYSPTSKMFDSNTISKFLSSENFDDLVIDYLKPIKPDGMTLKESNDIKMILMIKNLKHSSWVDIIPALRSYYKLDYDLDKEVNDGKDTIFLKFKAYKEGNDKRVSIENINKVLPILIANMKTINAT